MNNALLEFRCELDRWQDAGKIARFWWRDDDAVDATPALDRLITLTAELRAPLGLAVIPNKAEPSLFKRLSGFPDIRVLLHGASHVNHAPADQKKAEFGPHRPVDAMVNEIASALSWFCLRCPEGGQRFVPIFVPPWNRIDPALVARLSEADIARVSTFNPRRRQSTGPIPINTHVDPIGWKRGKAFLGWDAAMVPLLTHLEAKRLDDPGVDIDPGEPTGLLSHHLVQDDATWDFLHGVGQVITDHPAAEWADPSDLAKDPR